MFNAKMVIKTIIICLNCILMYGHFPDVVFVTESWRTGYTLDSQLYMTGYELYRFDRSYN